jgi:drug/metabolite transporter (DMT)-like permease
VPASSRLTRTDLLVLSVVLIWGSAFAVIKYASRELPALSFAALRLLIATGSVLLWGLLVEGRSVLVIDRRDWARVVVVGLIGIGVYQVLFHQGISYTSASNSSLLAGTSPIWTVLIAARWHQERIVPLQIVGILLSFAGLTLVIAAGNTDMGVSWQTVRGDVLTLLAAVASASGAVLVVDILERYPAHRVLGWAMACGTLSLLVLAWPEMVVHPWRQVSASAWMALAYGGVVVGGLGYAAIWKSIGEVGATRTMVYNSLVPPVAIVIAVVTLGEVFTPLQALGAVATLGGVAMTRFAPAKGG